MIIKKNVPKLTPCNATIPFSDKKFIFPSKSVLIELHEKIDKQTRSGPNFCPFYLFQTTHIILGSAHCTLRMPTHPQRGLQSRPPPNLPPTNNLPLLLHFKHCIEKGLLVEVAMIIKLPKPSLFCRMK